VSNYHRHCQWTAADADGRCCADQARRAVPDSRRAQAFYSKLLGWKFNEGSRNSAAIETAGVPGGVHEAAEPGLVVFFSVPDLEAAVRRVRELGGEVDPRRSEAVTNYGIRPV
jgi:predicted enzyme related to lactoylglutathione lyase